jgi:peptidoglycan/xylan/chitin deacetylase (PgdA/CDA1 family)
MLPQQPRPSILMYHRVASESFDPWGLCVTADRFRDQLRWLTDNRTVLPLEEFARRHRDRILPADAVALTFDDGYECTAIVAAPMLEAAGLPATIFIPAELVERGEPFWWDELQSIVLQHDENSLTVDAERVWLGEKQPDDHRWRPGSPPRTDRQRAFYRIWAALREKEPAGLDAAMMQLRGQSSVNSGLIASPPMSPAQVRATSSELLSFGSHALTHPWLTSLDTAEKAHEIRASVARCAALTGSAPTAFAYPYGNFDAESERLVQDAGFAFACATRGRAVTPKSSLFALPRMQAGNWTGKELGRALSRLP